MFVIEKQSVHDESSRISFNCVSELLNVTVVEISFWFCLLASFIPYTIFFAKVVF